MVEVFISYKREEREAVTTLADRLRALRLAVWWDADLTHGAGFDEEISTQLQAARCVLVCWTPAALASEWVRGEAAMAHGQGKLVACFLEPTTLTPPFNLHQTEDLMRWAGQDDDPGWIRLLEAIGERLSRPGLASYAQAMAPGASVQTLRDWAQAHGDDPLAEGVWARIQLIEGEADPERLAREALEARMRDQKRKADDARSKALAKARGLRDPAAQRRRILALAVAVTAVAVMALGGIGYAIDAQRRAGLLAQAQTPDQLRDFMAAQGWHPVAGDAARKYATLDAAAWSDARVRGTVAAIEGYIDDFTGPPAGQFLADARTALDAAVRVRQAQQTLQRLQLYDGLAHGAEDAATREAVELFQFRAGMPVTGQVDAALMSGLSRVIAALPTIAPQRLRARRLGEPTEDDYRALAARTGLPAPVLYAVRQVEATDQGFGPDGRPKILFERHIFSRLTQHAFDDSHPEISARRFSAEGYQGGHAGAWARLEAAYALDPAAAYASASYGLFQLLGMNHQRLGFDSPGEMAWFLSQSEAHQLQVFARFLEKENKRLVAALQGRDWAQFARLYNGPNYRANRYDERLAQAYDEGLRALGFFAQEERAGLPAAAASTPQR
jgi:peptidoglycan hydrolase-like protein with peptidoglycan-binding domain